MVAQRAKMHINITVIVSLKIYVYKNISNMSILTDDVAQIVCSNLVFVRYRYKVIGLLYVFYVIRTLPWLSLTWQCIKVRF